MWPPGPPRRISFFTMADFHIWMCVCGQMGPIPPLSVSPYLYLPAIRGAIKIPGSDKWNQSWEIWQFIIGLTTQSGIVPSPYSCQILIVQAGGAFTLEELSLAAPVFLAIMTWEGSREGHTGRESKQCLFSLQFYMPYNTAAFIQELLYV